MPSELGLCEDRKADKRERIEYSKPGQNCWSRGSVVGKEGAEVDSEDELGNLS